MQSAWRGKRIRRLFKRMYLRATAAAMRIQALARGNSTRRFLAYHRVSRGTTCYCCDNVLSV